MAISEFKTIAEIFSDRIFRIPDYQRGYAWGQEQLDQFWEDLCNVDSRRIRYHYTGILTLQPISDHYYRDSSNPRQI